MKTWYFQKTLFMNSIFKAILMKYFLALFVVITALNCSNHQLQTVDLTNNWDTLRILENPGKGWYHHLLDNGVDHYAISNDSVFFAFPGMDHLYLRLAWSYLEPKEGQFDWHRIDEVVDKYVPLGYGISFRISCKETGTFPETVNEQINGVQYATPSWVEKAGAKGTVSEAWNIKSWTPDWDDPVYLEKLDNFHRAFAARYDGKPWLRYVDIGSIGEWGEGHTFFSTKVAPTAQEVKANIDVYLKHYKHSQLVVTDDLLYFGKEETEISELYEYATKNSITLRDDSPMVDWYVQENLDTWSISHPHFYDSLYLHKPIVFELQHYGMVKEDGNWIGKNGADTITRFGHSGAEIMRKAIETMHATYIGYHGYAEEWLADNPDLTIELLNRCGYWFFPERLRIPEKAAAGQTLTFTIDWRNKGVAPAYEKFELLLHFLNEDSEDVWQTQLKESDCRAWMPDTTIMEQYSVVLPHDIGKGKFTMMVELKDPATRRNVEIGLAEKFRNEFGQYELTHLYIE